MKEFFTNSWVVSILTGLLVYGLTKLIESFRERKHYVNTLKLANDEVFNTLKTMIPEEKLPSPVVLFSLHRATAKKYGVKQEDMNVLPTIIDGLIKEILDSSFLSYQDKVLYSEKLLELIKNTRSTNESYTDVKNNQINGRDKIFSVAAALTSVFASIVVFAFDFLDQKLDLTSVTLSETSLNFIVAVLYLTFSIVGLIFVVPYLRDRLVDKKKLKKNNKNGR
jgi:hypothetical protein